MPGFNNEVYDQISHVLMGVDARVGASDVHGLLCGMLCSEKPVGQAEWLAQALASATKLKGDPAKDCLMQLASLYKETEEQLEDEELGFSLLLPDDDTTLAERAHAISKWCENFVFGIGISGLEESETLNRDVQEILIDLSEISRVEFELEQTDEDEDAFYEIVEYVRVSVMNLYEELRPVSAEPTTKLQ